jgi:hypothetical protein
MANRGRRSRRSRRPESPAPEEGRVVSAVSELSQALLKAFNREGQSGLGAFAERSAYVSALYSVGLFLQQVPTIHDYASKFMTLASALDDLDQGTVHSILKPTKIDSRPPDPTDVWIRRAMAAFAVEILLRCGMTSIQVKKLVDKDFGGLVAVARRSSSAGRTVITWRNTFVRGKVKNRIAQQVFHQELSKLDTKYEDSVRKEVRDSAMQLLAKAVLVGKP